MIEQKRQSGFSIAEVLIALGILTVALVFIAGVFPVGIHFTQKNIDETTAAIAANEAFAKTKLYSAVVPDDVNGSLPGFSAVRHRDFNDWFMDRIINYDDPNTFDDDYRIDVNGYAYPSDPDIDFTDKKYCWSAICRLAAKDPNDSKSGERKIQITVFVFNRGNHNINYYKANFGSGDFSNYNTKFGDIDYGEIISNTGDRSFYPQPVSVQIQEVTGVENEVQIVEYSERVLISDGDLLVDDFSGEIFRVLERYPAPDDDIILLDKKWTEPDSFNINNYYMWVVPPAAAPGGSGAAINLSGKSPLVGIYQREIRF